MAAFIDSGLALYESLMINRSSISLICIRHLLAKSAVDKPLAIASIGISSAVQTAAAANAFEI